MQPKQIMLVDDEPRLLSALRRRLSGEFDLVTFERGQAALDYLSKPHNVAVIVADMQMPEMNGIQLLSEVQKKDPDIRRLMLTGNSDQETAVAAINEAKVLRFIRKPCDAEALKNILREALEEYAFNKTDLSAIKGSETPQHSLAETRQTFLSVMSDELRTPIAQIITISSILAGNRSNIDTKTMDKFLGQISDSGYTALSQVDRILEFTRIQSSTVVEDDKEAFDIVSLIQKEIASSEQSAQEKLVTLSMESLRKNSDIWAVKNEIIIALKEALQNAIQLSEIGAHISIILRFDNDNVAMRIASTGSDVQGVTVLRDKGVDMQPQEGQSSAEVGLDLGQSLISLIAERNAIVIARSENANGGRVATFIFPRVKAVQATENLRLAS